MKIIKILQKHRKSADEQEIRSFLYKNMAQEMLIGLEYDDPKTIKRALKMFGLEYQPEDKDSQNHNNQPSHQNANTPSSYASS